VPKTFAPSQAWLAETLQYKRLLMPWRLELDLRDLKINTNFYPLSKFGDIKQP